MIIKPSNFYLLRRAGLPLLPLAAVSLGVAPASASEAAARKTAGLVVAKAADNSEMLELRDRVKELEARERQVYAMELEGQRKQVDWWLTLLGILAAIMAILGGLIPYLMGRKDKEIIEQDKTQIKRLLEEVKGMKAEAEDSVEVIHRHETEAEAAKKTIMNYQSGTPAAENEKVQEAAKKIEKDKTADPLLRLRAEAASASKSGSAEKAYKLWVALAELDDTDASIQFNAGYWAQKLGVSTQADEKIRWLKLAGQHYRQTLSIKPDMHDADNNWGSALAAEAGAIAAQDLPTARTLWKLAGEKYQQALSIKPDKHEAANNWGSTLVTEASAIAASDSEQSSRLLAQAEQLLLSLVGAVPGLVAYNLACVYGLRGDVQNCLKWLRVSHEHKTLPDCKHLGEDKDLWPVRNTPEFIGWFKQVCP